MPLFEALKSLYKRQGKQFNTECEEKNQKNLSSTTSCTPDFSTQQNPQRPQDPVAYSTGQCDHAMKIQSSSYRKRIMKLHSSHG